MRWNVAWKNSQNYHKHISTSQASDLFRRVSKNGSDVFVFYNSVSGQSLYCWQPKFTQNTYAQLAYFGQTLSPWAHTDRDIEPQ